jgi:hypothetical protein
MNLGYDAVSGMCSVCGIPVPLPAREHPATSEVTFFARCHGSACSFTVDEVTMRSRKSLIDALFSNKKFAAWAMDLFPHENMPDIRELMAYNRGTTPAKRVHP